MNTILAAFLTSLHLFAATPEVLPKESTLANEGDFISLHDVDSSSYGVFLSYTGVHFNKCGIQLRLNTSLQSVENLDQVLHISSSYIEPGKPLQKLHNGKLIALVDDLSESKYGEFFTISTADGRSLKEVIRSLSNYRQVEIIAEILHCQDLPR